MSLQDKLHRMANEASAAHAKAYAEQKESEISALLQQVPNIVKTALAEAEKRASAGWRQVEVYKTDKEYIRNSRAFSELITALQRAGVKPEIFHSPGGGEYADPDTWRIDLKW